MFPPGRPRLATSPSSTGSIGKIMTMGMLLVAFFAASAADPAGATITSTLCRTSSAASVGQSLDVPFGPSVLDDEVLALDPAELAQLAQECLEPPLHRLAGGSAQIADAVDTW